MTERDPMIGRVVLGRYRIVRALAKGGMGVVYLARTEGASGFSKPFVVKRMATDILVDTNMLKMFVREARVMSRMRHPGLVGVTDFGEEGGDYLMVLEYVHGYHLGQWHRYHRQTNGPFPVDLVIHIVCKVLDGLDYAHNLAGPDGRALEIVHRDVSPSNILIDVEGIVKLADFGVARSEEHTEKTEETTIKGKMPYLAPELFRLAKPTAATDAYAAAVVLHEIIVGRNEFRTGDMASTVSRVLEHTPTSVDHLRDDAAPELAAVLRKALHKNPEVRYKKASELASALRGVRSRTEEDADRHLRDLAQRDFLNPAMSELLGVVSLAARDEAWRNAPTTAEPGSIESDSPPTITAKGLTINGPNVSGIESFAGSVPAEPRSRFWPIVGAILLFGLAAGGIAFAIVAATQQKPPVIVEVGRTNDPQNTGTALAEAGQEVGDSSDNDIDASAAEREDAAMEADGETGNNPENRPTKAPVGPRPSSPQVLAQIVARKKGQFIACFSGQGGQRVSMSIRFSIDPAGRVSSASLAGSGEHRNIAQTPAGRCVLQVARATAFPRQPRPLTFSIPLTIQSI